MRFVLALAAAATVASCSYSDDVETVVDHEPRWISIDVDALGTAQVEPFEVAGRVALVRLDPDQLAALSHAMHDHHHRCGGFVVHDSLDDARLALAAVDRAPIAQLAVTYTIDNAAAVDRLLPALDESKLLTMIERLSESFPSRFHSSAGGLAVPGWLRDEWTALVAGRSDVTVELFAHKGLEQRSVIATIQGSTRPNEVIVIGGHIDSVAGGSSNAPGADDNASGISTLTEVLRVLMAKRFRPERTVKLMAYAAEEVGLRGSKSIVADFVAKGIDVVGVMNLDMTNYKGSPHDIYLMQDFTNAAQNAFVGSLIDTYVGATWGTSQCGYGCSDHASWHNAGFAATMPAEGRFEDTNPTIHSPNDTLAASNHSATHALKFARLATAYIAELGKGRLANAMPLVAITAPTATTLPASAAVELVATASDEEDGELGASIEWSSSRDGVLGTGASLSAQLSVGTHAITARVVDSAGDEARATTPLTIVLANPDDSGGGQSNSCNTGGPVGLAAACASLLAFLARRRQRRGSTSSTSTGR